MAKNVRVGFATAHGTAGARPSARAAAAVAASRRRKGRARWTAAIPHASRTAGVAVAALVLVAGVWLAAPTWKVGTGSQSRVVKPSKAGSWAPVTGYSVKGEYPHDPTSFTQGLAYAGDGKMYESSGGFGTSTLREVDIESGAILRSTPISGRSEEPDLFAEGIAVVEETGEKKLLLLTWKHQYGFVMSLPSASANGQEENFQVTRTWNFEGQGWGLAVSKDGKYVYMSNGSSTIRKCDAKDPEVTVAQIEVRDNGFPIYFLNDLQVIASGDHGEDEIWANVWFTQVIARIDPVTGQVRSWVDLSGILSRADSKGADVMNGIAHDATTGRTWITGKLWPKLFEIEVDSKPLKRDITQLAPFLFTKDGLNYINRLIT